MQNAKRRVRIKGYLGLPETAHFAVPTLLAARDNMGCVTSFAPFI
jgi:hypothetical protein